MIERPFVDMKATGEKLHRLRIQKNLSVKQLQNIMGFEYPETIYKWEHGKSIPTVDNLIFLSKIYNVKIDDIIQRS
jgi:transcriptional regulator with XRE-family HTH domain